MLIVLFGCTIGEKDTEAKQEQAIIRSIERIEQHASEIEIAASNLESLVDQIRRNIKEGQSKKNQKEDLQKTIQILNQKNKTLQQESVYLKEAIRVTK